MAVKPDFIIAGAGKAGTGALRYYLQQHPSIMMADREIDYFNNHYDEGIDWYQSFFNGARGVTGEKSPGYMVSEVAPERIHETIPDVKIIFLFRDPVDRAYSEYWFYHLKGDYYPSFKMAMEQDPRLKWTGEYITHIERYRVFFPDSQLLYLLSENLRQYTQETLTHVLDFLEVDNNVQFSDLSEQHVGMQSDSLIYKLLLEAHRKCFHGSPGPVADRISSTVKEIFQYAGLLDSYPPLKPSLREQYNAYFKPFNEQLEQETDLNLDIWRHNGDR